MNGSVLVDECPQVQQVTCNTHTHSLLSHIHNITLSQTLTTVTHSQHHTITHSPHLSVDPEKYQL